MLCGSPFLYPLALMLTEAIKDVCRRVRSSVRVQVRVCVESGARGRKSGNLGTKKKSGQTCPKPRGQFPRASAGSHSALPRLLVPIFLLGRGSKVARSVSPSNREGYKSAYVYRPTPTRRWLAARLLTFSAKDIPTTLLTHYSTGIGVPVYGNNTMGYGQTTHRDKSLFAYLVTARRYPLVLFTLVIDAVALP
jgi:hypothetical protein